MNNFAESISASDCLLKMYDEHHELEDYQKGVPRWCTGCGDNAILTAVQRLCRDENLLPEKTVFVSGIGCFCCAAAWPTSKRPNTAKVRNVRASMWVSSRGANRRGNVASRLSETHATCKPATLLIN